MTLVPTDTAPAQQWTRERIELLKDTIARNATDAEVAVFLEIAKRTGLDPFARQLYLIKRWDGAAGREVMSAQTSIDGYRLVASRTGLYAGQVGPQWCGEDGVWTDVWTAATPPAAARVGVLRQGFTTPLFRVAHWSEAAQWVKTRDGEKLTATWAKMPALMLAKVAESAALRAAFPAELSGLYTEEEMPPSREVAPPPLPTDDTGATLLSEENVRKLSDFCRNAGLDLATVIGRGTAGRTRNAYEVRTGEMASVSAAAKSMKAEASDPQGDAEEVEGPAVEAPARPPIRIVEHDLSGDEEVAEVVSNASLLATRAQVGKIKGEYDRLGVGDRKVQLSWTVLLLAMNDALDTHNNLTKLQANQLIEMLLSAADVEALDALVP